MKRITAFLVCLALLTGCRKTGPDLPGTADPGAGMALRWQEIPFEEGEFAGSALLTDGALYYLAYREEAAGIAARLYRCPYGEEPRMLYDSDAPRLVFAPAGEGAWIGESRQGEEESAGWINSVKQIGPDGALLREQTLPEETEPMSGLAFSGKGILCRTQGDALYWSGEELSDLHDTPLPEGMGYDLFPLTDGRMMGFLTDGEGEQAVIFDPAAGSFSAPFSLGREEGSLYLSAGEADLINYTAAGVLQRGTPEGEWAPLLDLADWELGPWRNGGKYGDIRLLPGGEILLLERGEECWRIGRLTPCPADQALPVLTLAGCGMSGIRGYVREYNRSQNRRIIRVKDYMNQSMSGYTALNTALMAGERPDLLCTDGFISARALIACRAFLDLTDYVDRDFGADWFLEGTLEKYTLAGGIWQLSPCFHMDCMIGNADLLGETPALTFEELERLRTAYPEVPVFFSEFMQEKMMTHMENACVQDFVDWETGSCDFQNERFMNMLELAASLPTMDDVMDAWNDDDGEIISSTESLGRGLILLSDVDMNGLWQYHRMQRMLNGRTVYPGFPNARGDGNVFSGVYKVGIMAGCADPEGAWDFIRWLVRTYSEELDVTDMYAYFPMGKEAFARFAARYQNLEDDYSLTDRDIARLYDLVCRTRPSTDYDEQITVIIEEEAAKYFKEKCTVEQAAAAIQSRVSLYIAEQS